MRRFSGIDVVVCAAIAVAGSPAAHAEVNPDYQWNDPEFRDSISPYLGIEGLYGIRQYWTESQPADCNRAGASTPRPVYDSSTQRASGSSSSAQSGGGVRLYGRIQMGLGEFFPGESSGSGIDFKDVGADQGPATDRTDVSGQGGQQAGIRGSWGSFSAGSANSPYRTASGIKWDPWTATHLQARRQGGLQSTAPDTGGDYENLDKAAEILFGESPTSSETPAADGQRPPMVGLRGSWGRFETGRLNSPYKYSGGVKYDAFVATELEARSYGRRDYYSSRNVETPIGEFPESLNGFVNQQYTLAGTTYTSLLFPEQYTGDIAMELQYAGFDHYFNPCWRVQVPTDPNFVRTGRHGGNSWGEKLDDQWAIKRVGLTGDDESAWNRVPADAHPVIVAVIDTGLDWHHLDVDADSIWRNVAETPGNGVDDDQNGYVDDIIGWDFMGKHNRPWDFDGHGTLVAGIIGASHNDIGIAGINPHARIMVLKAVSNFGTTRPSYIAEAIVYAADNGAKVINISVGGEYANRMVQAAVDFAHQQGVLVVAAAGNEGIELGDYGPGGNENVLTVGATHIDDRGAGFTNFGEQVDIAAPGVDVLSLRARFTDANYRPRDQEEGEYEIGQNYVGDDNRYIRASGTSFSAPIVSGVASLMLSANPEMTGVAAGQVLEQTAEDVDFPGKDKYTGHGMVDARAALSAAPDFSMTAEISSVRLEPADAPTVVRVYGTIDASDFKRAWVQIGPGENPGGWRYVGQKRKYPIRDGLIATIPLNQFTGYELWQVVVNVEDASGVLKRAAFPLEVR